MSSEGEREDGNCKNTEAKTYNRNNENETGEDEERLVISRRNLTQISCVTLTPFHMLVVEA
jgi:hypothetical protein